MKSRRTERFHKAFGQLPKPIQRQAIKAYRKFKKNPTHWSLHFKKVHSTKPIFSARINIDYRVLGIKQDEEIIWFWVGTHAEYERIINRI